MKRIGITALVLLWLFSASSASAVDFPEKPPDSDFFIDNAGLISADHRTQINTIAAKLLRERQIPLFIVTIESLGLYDAAGLGIEGYAKALFDHWGIGSEDFNYGILLLISRDDRKARIELGADFGHDFDPAAQRIMNRLIVPKFKQAEFSAGILDGVRGLDAMARGERIPAPTPPAWFLPALVIGAIALALIIWNLFRSGRSGWAWALIIGIGVLLFFILRASASGGSGGGFGGGSSGGGGATGSW